MSTYPVWCVNSHCVQSAEWPINHACLTGVCLSRMLNGHYSQPGSQINNRQLANVSKFYIWQVNFAVSQANLEGDNFIMDQLDLCVVTWRTSIRNVIYSSEKHICMIRWIWKMVRWGKGTIQVLQSMRALYINLFQKRLIRAEFNVGWVLRQVLTSFVPFNALERCVLCIYQRITYILQSFSVIVMNWKSSLFFYLPKKLY